MHAQITREMAVSGDWITPHLNAVRYFDKPPLLYWLSLLPFGVLGYTPAAARFWPAVGAVAVAMLTTVLGARLDGPRTGLIAGLVVIANLEMFVYGRLMKPDTVFVALIVLAFVAFARVCLGGGHGAVVLCGAALGLAVLAKDVLGALGPAAAMAVCLAGPHDVRLGWRRIASLAAVVLAAVAVPWYLMMEARSPGFLWYTVVDNHLLNFTRERVFPDEDVPLSALEFLGVTAVGFFPWTLALPVALTRTLRAPGRTAADRLWLMLALWTSGVVALFTLSPFKLSHYALPAFSAMALLVARVWSGAIAGDPRAPSARGLLVPAALGAALVALLSWCAVTGALPFPQDVFIRADVASRNAIAHGERTPAVALTEVLLVVRALALVFSIAAAALAAAAWRRATAFGLGVLLAAMVAALPLASRGMAEFARSRSAAPVAQALARRATPGVIVAVEGPIEKAASLLLHVQPPMFVVDGRRSTLAFGATFPDARVVFWTAEDLRAAWSGPQRCLLVTSGSPGRGALAGVPHEGVHLLAAGGGRALYSNRPDRAETP
jgi:hypothetical protein